MRTVYAAHLSFDPGTRLEDVVQVAGGWPCRGAAPEETWSNWDTGRRSYEIVTTDQRDGREVAHSLEVEVFRAAGGRLWEVSWRHPHSEDANLYMVSDVVVAEFDAEVTASLMIRTVWARPKVAMPRFSMRAPRLVRDLLSQFHVNDAGYRLTASPTRLDASDVPRFVDLLLDSERTRPVVFVADDPNAMRPLVNPEELARELAGMAHVFFSTYEYPADLVARQIGPLLACRNGAMRIWWPGLTRESNPYEHRLYAATSLREWKGALTPVDAVFRVLSVASATNATPLAQSALRRAARREALDGASSAAELVEIAEATLVENDRLNEQLKVSEDRAEMALLERDEAVREADELREAKIEADKQWARVLAEVGGRSPNVEDSPDATPPRTVLEAVQQAQPLCPHLVFADRAFESAASCPYEFPEDILEDLLKLERVAALWARPEGIGGMDMAAKATELGLHWKSGVSDVSTGGTKARQYEFTWRGEKRRVGPHTRRDRGNGAGRIARIYFWKYEPDKAEDRRLVVGVCGPKLEDSTTG